MPLTVTQVKSATPKAKPYKLADGDGMFLLVNPNGSKYWRRKYRFGKKEKLLALGVYPDITLKEARLLSDEVKRCLSKGIDPSAQRQAKKQASQGQAGDTFEFIAREWFSTRMADKSESHQKRTLSNLEKKLFPHIGNTPITSITNQTLLKPLRSIEKKGHIETAHRVKQTASQVFRYAIATGRADRDPAAELQGVLQTPKENHFPTITDPVKVGRLLRAIDGYCGTLPVTCALKLSPLLFCRPGELRHMEWAELNWEQQRWEIPASKMKTKMDHLVPLSDQAITILKSIQRLTGRDRYVFPSSRGKSRPLSENGVRTALISMGYDKSTIVPHGFRAMARTMLDEQLGFRTEWIEHQLAHSVKDSLGRAYNRTTFLKDRTAMMQAWADYLDQLKSTLPPVNHQNPQVSP